MASDPHQQHPRRRRIIEDALSHGSPGGGGKERRGPSNIRPAPAHTQFQFSARSVPPLPSPQRGGKTCTCFPSGRLCFAAARAVLERERRGSGYPRAGGWGGPRRERSLVVRTCRDSVRALSLSSTRHRHSPSVKQKRTERPPPALVVVTSAQENTRRAPRLLLLVRLCPLLLRERLHAREVVVVLAPVWWWGEAGEERVSRGRERRRGEEGLDALFVDVSVGKRITGGGRVSREVGCAHVKTGRTGEGRRGRTARRRTLMRRERKRSAGAFEERPWEATHSRWRRGSRAGRR